MTIIRKVFLLSNLQAGIGTLIQCVPHVYFLVPEPVILVFPGFQNRAHHDVFYVTKDKHPANMEVSKRGGPEVVLTIP